MSSLRWRSKEGGPRVKGRGTRQPRIDVQGDKLTTREMVSPASRKLPQPAEGTEFPQLNMAELAKQRGV